VHDFIIYIEYAGPALLAAAAVETGCYREVRIGHGGRRDVYIVRLLMKRNSPCACSHFTLCTIYRSVRMSKAVIIMLSKHRTENDKLDSLSGELSTVMSHFCIRQGRTRRFTLTLPYFTYSRGRRVTATALRPPGGPMCVPDLTFGLYENLLEF